MPVPSYSDAFGVANAPVLHQEILVGDHVCTGKNGFPQFEVVALVGEKAWVRDLQTGVDHFALVARCRKLPSPDPRLPMQ